MLLCIEIAQTTNQRSWFFVQQQIWPRVHSLFFSHIALHRYILYVPFSKLLFIFKILQCNRIESTCFCLFDEWQLNTGGIEICTMQKITYFSLKKIENIGVTVDYCQKFIAYNTQWPGEKFTFLNSQWDMLMTNEIYPILCRWCR